MWLLDTNVISELRKGLRCVPSVWDWYSHTPAESVFLSALVLGEIRFGIENIRARDPAKTQFLERWLEKLETSYGNRILPVTSEICDCWGRLSVGCRLPPIDGLQAATAIHHGLTFVTRNKKDVERCGVAYYDPFAG